MKNQFVICAIFLLGLVGMKSSNKEQLQHLWSVVAGSALPTVVLSVKQNDVKCPVNNEMNKLANPGNSDNEEFSALTCYLLFNTVKQREPTCERFLLSTSQNLYML